MSARESGRDGGRATPLPERVLGMVSAVVILALAGYLILRAVRSDGSPPEIVVEMSGVTAVGAGWLVEVEATNLGSAAAIELEIEGEMPGPGGSERRSVILDYLPPRSTRRGGLYFTGDPRTRPLTLRAVGFRAP